MIEKAMKQWLDCKQAEKKATYQRKLAEKELEKIVKIPDEGSETIKTASFKLTVKQSVTRKIDERKARQIFNEMPEGLTPINWIETAKLDLVGYRWLKENEPGLFKIFSDCITEKKGKANFNVEEIR